MTSNKRTNVKSVRKFLVLQNLIINSWIQVKGYKWISESFDVSVSSNKILAQSQCIILEIIYLLKEGKILYSSKDYSYFLHEMTILHFMNYEIIQNYEFPCMIKYEEHNLTYEILLFRMLSCNQDLVPCYTLRQPLDMSPLRTWIVPNSVKYIPGFTGKILFKKEIKYINSYYEHFYICYMVKCVLDTLG